MSSVDRNDIDSFGADSSTAQPPPPPPAPANPSNAEMQKFDIVRATQYGVFNR